jgi:hypothetical protein
VTVFGANSLRQTLACLILPDHLHRHEGHRHDPNPTCLSFGRSSERQRCPYYRFAVPGDAGAGEMTAVGGRMSLLAVEEVHSQAAEVSWTFHAESYPEKAFPTEMCWGPRGGRCDERLTENDEVRR